MKGMKYNAAIYPFLVRFHIKLAGQISSGPGWFFSHLKQSISNLPNINDPRWLFSRLKPSVWGLPNIDDRHSLKSSFHVVIIAFFSGSKPSVSRACQTQWSDDPRCKPQTTSSRMETVHFRMLARCLRLVLEPSSRPKVHPPQDLLGPLSR